jgi:hypothetical protein
MIDILHTRTHTHTHTVRGGRASHASPHVDSQKTDKNRKQKGI